MQQQDGLAGVAESANSWRQEYLGLVLEARRMARRSWLAANLQTGAGRRDGGMSPLSTTFELMHHFTRRALSLARFSSQPTPSCLTSPHTHYCLLS